MVDLEKRLAVELKKKFMEDLKKELKEELKQELKLELKTAVPAALKVAHSEGNIKTRGGKARAVEAGEAGGGRVEIDSVEEQGVDVEEISHGVPSTETRKEDVAKKGAVHGEHVGQQASEEAVVDDEEQGESAKDRETGLIMGP